MSTPVTSWTIDELASIGGSQSDAARAQVTDPLRSLCSGSPVDD
jgi:hypothetical protein